MLMDDSDTPAREVDLPVGLLPGSLAASGASAERYRAPVVSRGDPTQSQAQPSVEVEAADATSREARKVVLEKAFTLRELNGHGTEATLRMGAEKKGPGRKRWKALRRHIDVTAALKADVDDMRRMIGSVHTDAIYEDDKLAHMRDDENRVILPDSRFRNGWDVAQVCLLLYVMVMVPIRFGFDQPPQMYSAIFWWEVAVDGYFIIDLILNFFMAYVDKLTNILVTSRVVIRNNYLTGWFIIDFFSVLPISHINRMLGKEGGGQTKALKILRMVRLAKLLRLARLRYFIKKHSETIDGLASAYKMGGLLWVILMFGHFNACGWYYVGVQEDGTGWVPHFFPEPPLGCDSSPTDQCVEDADMLTKYVITFAFSLACFKIGARPPGLHPTTLKEHIYFLLVSLMGAIVSAIVVGSVCSIFLSKSLADQKVDKQLAELRDYLTTQKIPAELNKEIRTYMEHLYRMKTGYDIREVLDTLPTGIKMKLLDHMYRRTILKIPMFKGSGDQIVEAVCIALKPRQALKDEVVFRERERAQHMFILDVGGVKLERYSIVLGHLSEGSFFGHEGLLPGRNWRENTATTTRDSTLAFLTQNDMKEIFKQAPELIEKFKEVGVRMAQHEGDRLTQLLKDTAVELGVDETSDVMEDVLTAVESLSNKVDSVQYTDAHALKACQTIQRHFRGFTGRKRARFAREALRTRMATRLHAFRTLRPADVGTKEVVAGSTTLQLPEIKTGTTTRDMQHSVSDKGAAEMMMAGALMRKASAAKRAVRASRAAELNRKGQNPEIMAHAERLVSKLSTSKLSPNSRLPKLAKKKQAATPLQQRQYWEDDETTLSMVMVEQRAQSAKLNALVEKLDAVVLSLSLSKKTQEQLQEHAAAQQAETMAAAAAATTAAATAAAGATTGGIGLVASTIGGGGRATAQQAKKIAELQERLRTLSSSATHAEQ